MAEQRLSSLWKELEKELKMSCPLMSRRTRDSLWRLLERYVMSTRFRQQLANSKHCSGVLRGLGKEKRGKRKLVWDERSVVAEITGSQQFLNTFVIFYVVNSRQIHIMVCVNPHVELVPEMLKKIQVHLFKFNILSGKHCDKYLNHQINFHVYIFILQHFAPFACLLYKNNCCFSSL